MAAARLGIRPARAATGVRSATRHTTPGMAAACSAPFPRWRRPVSEPRRAVQRLGRPRRARHPSRGRAARCPRYTAPSHARDVCSALGTRTADAALRVCATPRRPIPGTHRRTWYPTGGAAPGVRATMLRPTSGMAAARSVPSPRARRMVANIPNRQPTFRPLTPPPVDEV